MLPTTILISLLLDIPMLWLIFCGYAGGSMAMRIAAPALMNVDKKGKDELVRNLTKSRFVLDESDKFWKSPLPAWLVWENAVVSIEELGNGKFLIEGPMFYLRILCPKI